MIVYRNTKNKFLKDVEGGDIAVIIRDEVKRKLHKTTAESEYRSWNNSMQFMYRVLMDKKIPSDCTVAIEYRIPNTNKRIDFMISGEEADHKESAVIVELKQWEYVLKVPGEEAVVMTELHNNPRAKTVHPSYQAWSYASTIYHYNESVRENKIELKPCAYLHNYHLKENDDLLDPSYAYYLKKAPVFTSHDTKRLSNFIAKYIHKGNAEVMYHIEHGRIVPSKALQDCLDSLMKGNQEFDLIDEQKVFFEKALSLVRNQKDKKQVYIIHGGPGTGKSVLAVNLLRSILDMSKNTMYVTKNSAPRNVYMKKLEEGGRRKAAVENLFKSSGAFVSASDNEFDCLVVDEAHRLNAKSGIFHNQGENQVKEIIHAARTSIFFVDDDQIVTLQDIGSTDEIKKWCRFFNADVYEDTLHSQFRCSGSDSYLSWIDNVFEINRDAPDDFDFDYDIRVLDSPEEVYQLIVEKNKENNKSRMVAGYCWDWNKEGKGRSDIHDIKIGSFEKSWNLNSTSTWAIDPESVEEIGCIHTCQGLEFDYVGVIIGDDMRYEGGIVTDFSKRARTDQSLKGIKTLYKKNPELAVSKADRIIKNTYKTLITRGQKGCFIYCTDKNLSDYLKERLEESRRRRTESYDQYRGEEIQQDNLAVAESNRYYHAGK